MTDERWERVKELLHGAMQLAPDQRARFLDEACHSQDSLRAEVESLLLAEEEIPSTFLQSAPLAARQDAATNRIDPAGALDALLPKPGHPARFGPYEILGPIAKGGMGEVYRARDTRLGRYVAVKILPAELCHDPVRLARFEHEARAASALNHPNIVSVYDIGRENDIPFIVTELIEGESLRRLITKGPVPVEQLRDIATQLAAGLRAAHAAGIVHRDLKPENVMLTPDLRVKILDFGLAKHIPHSPDAVSYTETVILTAPGLVMGTVGYLSPEQVRGETADERSDIFSLGAMLYELAEGKRPFTGAKAVDVVSAILRDQPPQLRANIPPALDRIIRRCLEKDAQRRFENASSLAAALKNIGEASGARRLIWAIERRKKVAWLVPAAVLVAIAIWFVPDWRNRHTLPAGASPPATSQQAVTQSTGESKKPVAAEASLNGKAGETAPPLSTTEPAPGSAPESAPGSAKTEPPAVPTAVIETLAGRPWKFAGDGRPAREVALGHIDDVKCDREGNIYAADWGNQAIVKIDRSGILHVLAGPESLLDGQPRAPHFLIIDSSRAIYFSQPFVIRKLLPSGHVVPFAGTYTTGFTADGLRAQGSAIGEVAGMVLGADGSVIFSELGNQRVRRVDLQGNLQTIAGNGIPGFAGDGGPAERASLAGPRGLALDRAGNLFIADASNRCVRKVSPDGRIWTVAGHGVGGNLSCPSGVAVNQRDDLFVADPCIGQVLLVRDGSVTVFGGKGVIHGEPSGDGGPATAASFDLWELSFDEQENLLIAGPDFGHIYRISPDGRFNIIAGSGTFAPRDGTPGRQASFRTPFRLAVDRAANIFMTDLGTNSIYRLDRKGIVTLIAGYPGFTHGGYGGEDTPARYYRLNGPHGIRVRPNGNVVFADRDNSLVREVTASGQLRTIAGNRTHSWGGDGGRAVDAALNHPQGVCLDNAGNVYIADTDNHRVRRVGTDGRILTVAGNGVPSDSGDGGPAERAGLNTPTAVEVDANGDLYIADLRNHRIRRVSRGVITTLAGDGHLGLSGDGGPATTARLDSPAELALSPDRQLFVLDPTSRRIRKIDLATGIITAFAGNGESTTSGDGGPPTKAGLGLLAGIAVDAAGNVYVTDVESRQLRIIRPAPQR
jgi:serine/threonine protein kinase/sugar lactone lactonase YvrE